MSKREVTAELLDEIQDAFNRHDVDGILSHFADDCEWLMARGLDPREGRRLKGKAAIGEVLRARYRVIPDMRWEDMAHFIGPDGAKALLGVDGARHPDRRQPADRATRLRRVDVLRRLGGEKGHLLEDGDLTSVAGRRPGGVS